MKVFLCVILAVTTISAAESAGAVQGCLNKIDEQIWFAPRANSTCEDTLAGSLKLKFLDKLTKPSFLRYDPVCLSIVCSGNRGLYWPYGRPEPTRGVLKWDTNAEQRASDADWNASKKSLWPEK